MLNSKFQNFSMRSKVWKNSFYLLFNILIYPSMKTSWKLSGQYLFTSASFINSRKHNLLDLLFLLEYIQFTLLDVFPSCARDHIFLFLQSVLSNLLTVFRVLHWLCSKFKTSKKIRQDYRNSNKQKVINISLNENNRGTSEGSK